MSTHLDIPEAKGTPMPVKTPINFKARKEKLERDNKAAMRKLILTSILTSFFIVV